MKTIYLDNAAATPIDPRVLKAMNLAYKKYGNPSSFNGAGRLAREEVESARSIVARFLGARSEEIVFTSSGSEANNLTLAGYLMNKKGTVLVTPIEHPSVLECLRSMSNIKIKFLKINSEGLVDLVDLKNQLGPDILLVSVMYANNEIGTIQPIRQIAKIIKDFSAEGGSASGGNNKILFHVDACQAAGFLNMNVQHLGADLVTFNGSKIYGPRGIGVLYVRRGIKLSPLIGGGSQEHGLRAGTENMPAIVGLAKAVSLIKPTTNNRQLTTLRNYAIEQLEKNISDVLVNGPRGTGRLANNISICIPNLESENLLLELDQYGISAGSGSACTSHSVEPSHVLKAIGVPADYIIGALRFSLGRATTKKGIDYLVKSLVKIVADLTDRYARLR